MSKPITNVFKHFQIGTLGSSTSPSSPLWLSNARLPDDVDGEDTLDFSEKIEIHHLIKFFKVMLEKRAEIF